MANASNILVINDEAHHAWRKNPEIKVKLTKEEKVLEQNATIWIGALDRIQKTRKILTSYDFSATPFALSGKKNDEEALFSWIVSDFGLNDGIESSLVKTPRVVVRDDVVPDTESFKSKLYHIYADDTVKVEINRAASAEEPLPDLLNQAYYLLGKDWLDLYQSWIEQGSVIPPVMITVTNRTETAARIKYAFDHKRIPIEELCKSEYTIHIDSKTMEAAEGEEASDDNVPSDADDDSPNKKISKKMLPLSCGIQLTQLDSAASGVSRLATSSLLVCSPKVGMQRRLRISWVFVLFPASFSANRSSDAAFAEHPMIWKKVVICLLQSM